MDRNVSHFELVIWPNKKKREIMGNGMSSRGKYGGKLGNFTFFNLKICWLV